MLRYLVKSVLRAPVPAYCKEQASALSAHTKKDGTIYRYQSVQIFSRTMQPLTRRLGRIVVISSFAQSSILNREFDSLIAS